MCPLRTSRDHDRTRRQDSSPFRSAGRTCNCPAASGALEQGCMSLLAIQRSFRDHILAGIDVAFDPIKPEAMRGLAVYRHAYRAQLVACLRDTFEITWAWLGDESFDRAAYLHV